MASPCRVVCIRSFPTLSKLLANIQIRRRYGIVLGSYRHCSSSALRLSLRNTFLSAKAYGTNKLDSNGRPATNSSYIVTRKRGISSLATKPPAAVASRRHGNRQRTDDPPTPKECEAFQSLLEGLPAGKGRMAICPRCRVTLMGGMGTFLFNLDPSGHFVQWFCKNRSCEWEGRKKLDEISRNGILKSREPELKGEMNMEQQSTEHVEELNTTPETGILAMDNIALSEEERALQLEPLSHEIRTYFENRRITLKTLERNCVRQRTMGKEAVIAFTYWKEDKLVGCKYRTLKKRFWQERIAENIPYGFDDVKNEEVIIIVEGEIDKLSMEEAGYRNCMSVPNGAPPKVSEKELPAIEKDKRFSYLWNMAKTFSKAKRIILATDADDAGQALAEEIARRVGRERCWRVRWPEIGVNEKCKDANEVLMKLGSEALKQMIVHAELYPIRGLFKFSDFFTELDAYYECRDGLEMGVSTGWAGLDKLYKIVPGELTIVSGIPNCGKSEWIDALLCNLNHSESWRFALCSMENKVREHARKLLEKHIKKPFFDLGYEHSVPRMTCTELEEGKKWLNDSFFLIRHEDDMLPSIDWILQLAKVAVSRHGIRGLVIDPYNELDHQRDPRKQTETEYVSQMLSKVKRFAQHYGCHVWFVAHPRQLQNWDGSAPSLYDISGSAHFINKCDNGIVIHRNRDSKAGPLDLVQVHVRKVRNKVAGTIGDATLRYERLTGLYHDVDS